MHTGKVRPKERSLVHKMSPIDMAKKVRSHPRIKKERILQPGRQGTDDGECVAQDPCITEHPKSPVDVEENMSWSSMPMCDGDLRVHYRGAPPQEVQKPSEVHTAEEEIAVIMTVLVAPTVVTSMPAAFATARINARSTNR